MNINKAKTLIVENPQRTFWVQDLNLTYFNHAAHAALEYISSGQGVGLTVHAEPETINILIDQFWHQPSGYFPSTKFSPVPRWVGAGEVGTYRGMRLMVSSGFTPGVFGFYHSGEHLVSLEIGSLGRKRIFHENT